MNIYKEMMKYQDFRVQSNENNYWTLRQTINSIKDLESIKYRHRAIFIHEVVIDVDCNVREISTPVSDRISSRLQKDNIAHQVWDTSRSPHIHCFFKDMHLYPKEVRRMIRMIIMNHYSQDDFKWIDKGMANEDRNIRDFGSLHEDTRKPKILIYEFEGFNSKRVTPLFRSPPQTPFKMCQNIATMQLNPLNQEIMGQLRVLLGSLEKMPKTSYIAPTEADKKEMQEFITYCAENTLSADGKKTILSRNVAIACLLLGYDTNERHRIYYRVSQNSTSKILNNLISWDKWLQKKSNLHFNWREINKWYNPAIKSEIF